MSKANGLFRQVRNNKDVYLMVFPSVLFLAVFALYPIFWAFRYMFYDYDGFHQRFIGVENFIRLFCRDVDFWHSVLNTLIYAGGKIVITIPLALLLAIILNNKLKGRNFFRVIFFLPTITSTAVMSLIFYLLFNTYNGIVNQLLLQSGLIGKPIEWLGMHYAMLTAIIVAIWGAIGNNIILFLAGLQSVPAELYESASIDGANNFQKHIYITIPMISSISQLVVMLAIIYGLNGYESIMVLTGGGPNDATNVMYLYIYKKLFYLSESGASSDLLQLGYGSAVAFVSSIIVGCITVFYLLWSKKSAEKVNL